MIQYLQHQEGSQHQKVSYFEKNIVLHYQNPRSFYSSEHQTQFLELADQYGPLDVLYFSNEQGCSVSGYRLDTTKGTLSLFQTLTTLPAGYSDRNTCSQIQISRSGKLLFAPNRGHDSIACFTVDTETGELTANGIISSEARPNALCLGPGDRYLYSAGQDSGNLATFEVDQTRGTIDKIRVVPVGNGPCWISITQLND